LVRDALEASMALLIFGSNPPYVRSADIAQLAPEVCRFDHSPAQWGDEFTFLSAALPQGFQRDSDGWMSWMGHDQPTRSWTCSAGILPSERRDRGQRDVAGGDAVLRKNTD